MLLSDAATLYLLLKSSRCSETTIKTDRLKLRQFRQFVGDIDVADVSPTQIVEFLRHESERLSPFTVKRQYAAISAFYSWATSPDIDLAPSNPTDAVPTPKTPKKPMPVYSQDDIRAILQAAQQSGNPRRDKSLVLSLYDLCCRNSELCGIKLSDVGWQTGRVLVTGKGDKSRMVSLGQRALAALHLYLHEERPEPMQGNFVYLTRGSQSCGYPMSRHALRNVIARLGQRAGVHATCHKFRHSGLLSRLRLGMPLLVLRDWAGHQSVQTTEKYLRQLSSEDMQRVAKRTSPVDRHKLG